MTGETLNRRIDIAWCLLLAVESAREVSCKLRVEAVGELGFRLE